MLFVRIVDFLMPIYVHIRFHWIFKSCLCHFKVATFHFLASIILIILLIFIFSIIAIAVDSWWGLQIRFRFFYESCVFYSIDLSFIGVSDRRWNLLFLMWLDKRWHRFTAWNPIHFTLLPGTSIRHLTSCPNTVNDVHHIRERYATNVCLVGATWSATQLLPWKWRFRLHFCEGDSESIHKYNWLRYSK